MMKKPLGLLMMLVMLSACVTINIYFPAAQAQEAAERIVDDILQTGPTPRVKQMPAEDDKQGSLQTQGLMGSILDFLIPPAHAAQPNFSVETPEIRKIQASLKSRHGSLEPFYDSGALGFSDDGRLAVHNDKAVSLKDRTRMKQLMDQENADRDRLYQAIAEANGQPQWEQQVRDVFADTWINKAKGGWWYRKDGKWMKK